MLGWCADIGQSISGRLEWRDVMGGASLKCLLICRDPKNTKATAASAGTVLPYNVSFFAHTRLKDLGCEKKLLMRLARGQPRRSMTRRQSGPRLRVNFSNGWPREGGAGSPSATIQKTALSVLSSKLHTDSILPSYKSCTLREAIASLFCEPLCCCTLLQLAYSLSKED
jgi:hypothetical protein